MIHVDWKKIASACVDRFRPASVQCIKEGLSGKTIANDCLAGIIVAVVALPLAIAFAVASIPPDVALPYGLTPPQVGLITAVVAGLVISLFGGCRVQIGGPTGAFIVIVYGILQQYGYEGLLVATLLAGAILVVLGLCGLGSIIKYIPYPVTVGFTAGIALIIFAGQIPELLGLAFEAGTKMPGDFIGKLQVYVHATGFNPWALGISIVTLIICFQWRRVTTKIPGSIVAILLTTVLVQLFDIDVKTIGDAFPAVSSGMHMTSPHAPAHFLDLLRNMFPTAITIALLAGIESLLSAVVADGMTGKRHNSNTELIAQGLANLASPLFGGLPATGAIARTATNIKNGGLTPISGIIHAIALLLIMLFLGKYAAMIPMAALAGVVAQVAYNMSEWHLIKGLLKSTRSDVLVMITTFALTVIIDLTVAIEAGILLAAFLFIRRMSESTEARNITRVLAGGEAEGERPDDLGQPGIEVPNGVEVFEVYGALFFGAADKFKDTLLSQSHVLPKVLILRMRHVLALDATALHSLEEVFEHTKRRGVQLVLSGVTAQPLVLMVHAGFLDKIGKENVHGHISDALARSHEILAGSAPTK